MLCRVTMIPVLVGELSTASSTRRSRGQEAPTGSATKIGIVRVVFLR
jgi:hypothetical protein